MTMFDIENFTGNFSDIEKRVNLELEGIKLKLLKAEKNKQKYFTIKFY